MQYIGTITLVNTIAERMKEARERAGLSQPALAERAGVSQGTIGNIESGIRKRPRELLAIAAALGVSPEWLENGKDSGASVHAPVLAPESGAPAIRVPLLANAGSMGPGTDIQHDDVLVGHISLSEQWVARRLQPTSVAALRFIHAYGDSMHPTFEDGDVLLVDTGMRDPKAIDGVYVMAANDRVYIKRVRQRMDGVVEISSDNPTVKTVDVLNGDHSVDVLGRVVWCWNGRKL